MVDFVRNYFVKINFEAVLGIFSCYDYGANSSEAVQKIATDQKEYHKFSSCVIIC